MHRRLSPTCLPLLALAVALVLLGHDVTMAAGPHDSSHTPPGAHAGDHDGMPDDSGCGELVAARTNDAGPGLDLAMALGDAVMLRAVPAGAAGGGPSDGTVTLPPPTRAMLQVWLN